MIISLNELLNGCKNLSYYEFQTIQKMCFKMYAINFCFFLLIEKLTIRWHPNGSAPVNYYVLVVTHDGELWHGVAFKC